MSQEKEQIYVNKFWTSVFRSQLRWLQIAKSLISLLTTRIGYESCCWALLTKQVKCNGHYKKAKSSHYFHLSGSPDVWRIETKYYKADVQLQFVDCDDLLSLKEREVFEDTEAVIFNCVNSKFCLGEMIFK